MLPLAASASNRTPALLKASPEGRTQSRRKGVLRSVRCEFVDATAEGIRLKQVARAVKGQPMRTIQPGGEGAYYPARRVFIEVAA